MNSSNESRGGEVVVYEAPDGQVRVEVRLERETVWLSLNQMAELFGRDKSVISRHLRNVFESKELEREAVVAKNATTAADGKAYQVEYFNLDAILSVGYRVNSKRGTQFRNKRIGTLLFLDYLRRNGLLLRADGSPVLADNAMVALALLVAESAPAQKDLMIRLILNLIGDETP